MMGFLAEDKVENNIVVRAKTKQTLLKNAIGELLLLIYAHPTPVDNKKFFRDEVEVEAEDFEDLTISLMQKTIDMSKGRKITGFSIKELTDLKVVAEFTSQQLDNAEIVKKLGLVTYYGFSLTSDRGTFELKFHYD